MKTALVTVAALALLGSCSKESTGTPKNSQESAPPAPAASAAKSGQPPAEKGVAAPTEAIGANRTETLALSGDATIADTAEYTLSLKAPKDLAKGASARVWFVVKPKKGWHMNEEFPPKLKINPPEGVEVDKPNQGKEDADSYTKHEASWSINVKATTAGTKTFTGKLKFAVCTETTCNPRKPELAFALDVK